MSKYLTVSQYKRYNEGVPLSDVNDLTLGLQIAKAEAALDAHMGFDTKKGGFEPHFVMVQSAFNQHTRKTPFPQYPIPIRQITRYRIQVSNVSTSGAGFFATIQPADCVINNFGYYVEIVPLQAVTYALSPVLLQLGLNPPIVEMDCEVGNYLPVFGETLFNSGDNTSYFAQYAFWAATYTQALSSQPNLLPPVPPVVYVNGSVTASSNYTVNYTEGIVTFNTPNAPGSIVTCDYTHTIPDFVTLVTIIQTTHYIGQRQLNQAGLYPELETIRSGDQEIQRPRFFSMMSRGRAVDTALCAEAASLLARYDQIAMA